MHQHGTAIEHGSERHERGWFHGADGRWRAYDGFHVDPLCEMTVSPVVMGAETIARMQDLLAEHPALRIAS